VRQPYTDREGLLHAGGRIFPQSFAATTDEVRTAAALVLDDLGWMEPHTFAAHQAAADRAALPAASPPAGTSPPATIGVSGVLLFLAACAGWWVLPLGILAGTAAGAFLVTNAGHQPRGWWLLGISALLGEWWVSFFAIGLVFHGWSWSVL
jgi:hypothetical protein